jgi:UDP-2,3-diacylglucosamine pyrophosphatase LpxH
MNTLVISDLHMGNGGSYDIFAGEAELPKLLATFRDGSVHVVLNGDTFDFLLNDDSLGLQPGRAEKQARDIVGYSGTAAVLTKLGDIAKAGGRVTFISGNHDLEIGLPSVQALIVKGMGAPASGVAFHVGDEPLVLATGAGSVLVAHGEKADDWNRFVHKDVRPDEATFRYPPGSKLVKSILNRAKKDHGLRFADLLKPDFSGAVLAALAVKPSVVSEIAKQDTGKLLYQLVRRKTGTPDALVEIPTGTPLGASPLEEAELTDEEQLALEALTDDIDHPEGFIGEQTLKRALAKVGTAALKAYASAHRFIAGDSAAAYFSLEPDEAEWKAAGALGDQYQTRFVVAGHTHSARWARSNSFGYLNTGTWIHLMRLPAKTAGADEWAAFLNLLKKDPGLVGDAKGCLIKTFNCAWIDEKTGPSLKSWDGVKLVEQKPHEMLA